MHFIGELIAEILIWWISSIQTFRGFVISVVVIFLSVCLIWYGVDQGWWFTE